LSLLVTLFEALSIVGVEVDDFPIYCRILGELNWLTTK